MNALNDYPTEPQQHLIGKVFIVDDDAQPRESIAALVDAMGVEVFTFPSGEAFLASPHLHDNGCLVTDLRMPGMNGLELLKRLRAQEIEIPIILVSAYVDVRIAVDTMAAGAFRVVEKPYNDQELWDAIVSAIQTGSISMKKSIARRSLAQRQASLTESENEVMHLILSGYSNKQISYQLDISPRTVDLRRQAILSKMEFQNIVELATALGSHDLIVIDELEVLSAKNRML